MWEDIEQKGKVQTFGLAGRPPSILSLSGTFRSSHKETSDEVLGLFTLMILKTVIESVFFLKSTNLQHARLKTKSGGKPFIVFNLLNIIIYPFQGKQQLKTY